MYEAAAEAVEANEVMLKTLFYQMAEESQEYLRDLTVLLSAQTDEQYKFNGIGFDPDADFKGGNASAILRIIEDCERTVQSIYGDVLSSRAQLPESARRIITEQKLMLNMSLELVRNRAEELEMNHKTKS